MNGYLQQLPAHLGNTSMAALDQAFDVTNRTNPEVAYEWLTRAIKVGYSPAAASLEMYLTTYGRVRYVAPLYKTLAATERGQTRARAIFEKAKPGYHPLTVRAVQEVLGIQE